VSGLRRVLPLGPATHKPTGTARELARARGAWRPVRADPVLTVAAALDGIRPRWGSCAPS
jgi:hypothetical protein